MLERVLIAGSGGQGVILAGKILATTAALNIQHVTFYPAYGAEVRGGTSNCQIILSSEEIASPVSEELDSIIILNQASCKKFAEDLTPEGLLIVNSSLCTCKECTIQAAGVPASDTAHSMGDVRAANFIMLGAYLARKQIVDPDDFEATLRLTLAGKPESIIDLNIQAFRKGLTL